MARRLNARAQRARRHMRLRQGLAGTPERPRLAVFRSLNNMYAQLIDDTRGNTILAASSLEREVRDHADRRPKAGASRAVGQLMARRARERGVERVVFDRGGFKYHGRVKALADAAREGGLLF